MSRLSIANRLEARCWHAFYGRYSTWPTNSTFRFAQFTCLELTTLWQTSFHATRYTNSIIKKNGILCSLLTPRVCCLFLVSTAINSQCQDWRVCCNNGRCCSPKEHSIFV